MDRSNHGYLRSVVGNLEMTTDEWRGTAPAPDPEPEPEPEPDPDDSDTVAPKLTGLSTTSQPPATASEAKAGTCHRTATACVSSSGCTTRCPRRHGSTRP
jgi:hypothetical protein